MVKREMVSGARQGGCFPARTSEHARCPRGSANADFPTEIQPISSSPRGAKVKGGTHARTKQRRTRRDKNKTIQQAATPMWETSNLDLPDGVCQPSSGHGAVQHRVLGPSGLLALPSPSLLRRPWAVIQGLRTDRFGVQGRDYLFIPDRLSASWSSGRSLRASQASIKVIQRRSRLFFSGHSVSSERTAAW